MNKLPFEKIVHTEKKFSTGLVEKFGMQQTRVPVFKVTFCDLESSVTSSMESWNMKSAGKRSILRFICWLNAFVVYP